jgi:hypothetical protein
VRIRCPACHREEEVAADFRWRPFCSRRCKIIDLGNWLDEVYRIPVAQTDDGDEVEDLPRDASAS